MTVRHEKPTTRLLCAVFLSCFSASLCAQQSENPSPSRVRVIEPEQQGNEAQTAAIDTEKFQLGAYMGSLSVEDFGTNVVTGIELTYHLSADWFLQSAYGVATIDRAAFESNQLEFLSSDDRDFKYLTLGGGYRWISGRSFMGSRAKYNSDIYVLAGAEKVSFAANDEWGLNFGLSYRVVLTDWMTLNVDFREHTFKREFIGDSKQTFNTEFRLGLNGLF